MFRVVVETEKKAEKRSGKRAYLARLSGADREFAAISVDDKNRRGFTMRGGPGDVFEARRWWWGDGRDAGGVVWFTVDSAGKIHSLSRDQAISAASAPRLEQDTPVADGPMIVTKAERFAPERVWCFPENLRRLAEGEE